MNYIIRVIDHNGDVVHTEFANEPPSQFYLDNLTEFARGEFCDVARK